jgi:3',5'-cyclic-AMP phosphodiesterase
MISAMKRREFITLHARRIRYIFMGHVHRTISGHWLGIPYTIVRGTNHQVAPDFTRRGGDIIGSHEPPIYAVALLEKDCIVVHVCEYLDHSPRFPLRAHEIDSGTYPLTLRF